MNDLLGAGAQTTSAGSERGSDPGRRNHGPEGVERGRPAPPRRTRCITIAWPATAHSATASHPMRGRDGRGPGGRSCRRRRSPRSPTTNGHQESKESPGSTAAVSPSASVQTDQETRRRTRAPDRIGHDFTVPASPDLAGCSAGFPLDDRAQPRRRGPRRPAGPGQQAQRHRQQRTQRTEDPGPEHQGQEGERRGSPTASPTTRGWMIDWITKLITRVDGDHGQHQLGPALEQRRSGRRDDPDDEADVGDEVGDEGEHGPHEGARDAHQPRARRRR